jgi:hypothetical protein
MDEQHIQQMIGVMLACHGAEAESAARKRANRCLRRKEPEWAALWREVAERLARGDHGTAPPAPDAEPSAAPLPLIK